MDQTENNRKNKGLLTKVEMGKKTKHLNPSPCQLLIETENSELLKYLVRVPKFFFSFPGPALSFKCSVVYSF